jgi:5'-AMP-activated protein kinase catalytic alpha subunit
MDAEGGSAVVDGGDADMHGAEGGLSGRGGERELKFEIQLYKARDGEYILDVQRLQGGLLHFLGLAADILAGVR